MSIPSANHQNVKASLSGFEHIRRHWNEMHQSVVAIIEPGQFYVTNHSELIMTTLGSCISACVRDPQSAVGGMNHFMLPAKGNIYQDKSSQLQGAMRYGNWAMEFLINQILKTGAKRRNLEVKVFGAGGTFDAKSVCEMNIKFITEYLHDENLKLAAQDLGGSLARTIVYNPITGKILRKTLDVRPKELDIAENKYNSSLDKSPSNDDIELF